MADPRAFLSFDFDNNETEKILFAGQAKNNSPTPFTVEDWSSKEPLPESEWEEAITEKLNMCHLMIVLVGRSMATATGVAKEIAMASDLDVPFFGVYVDSADSKSTLPSGLARSRTIAWTWDGVGNFVDQVMGEGKNAS